MIKLLYVIVIITVLFVGLTFTYMNSQSVEVNYFSLHKETSLAVLLLVTLIIGAVAGFFASMFSSLKVRRNLSKLKRELKNQQLSGL